MYLLCSRIAPVSDIYVFMLHYRVIMIIGALKYFKIGRECSSVLYL